MSPDFTQVIGLYAGDVQIPRDPVIHSARAYRVVIEDEETGQEFRGWSGLSRVATERIAALVNHVGAHGLAVGELPKSKRAREHALENFALDVARGLDGRAPAPKQPRRALTVTRRKGP